MNAACALLLLFVVAEAVAEAEAEAGAVADAAQCSEAGKERSWEYMQQEPLSLSTFTLKEL